MAIEGFTVTGIPKLTDKQKVLKRIDKALEKLWRGAIRAFVFATANRVRVQTGMARASILPLARFVRVGLVLTRLGGGLDRDARRRGLRNLPYNGPEKGFRSKSRGEREFGPRSFNREEDVTITRGLLRFEFTITVHQWIVNEDKWKALTAGRTAFEQHIDANQRDLLVEIKAALIESLT